MEPPLFPLVPYDRAGANYVALIGVLGMRPELQQFASGKMKSNLSIAINSKANSNAESEW